MSETCGDSKGGFIVTRVMAFFLLVYFALPVIPLYLGIYFGPSNQTADRVLSIVFYPVLFLIEHSTLYQELYIYQAKLFGLLP